MKDEKKTAALSTLGCRVNQYESDVIAEELARRGFDIVVFGRKADVTVINTCAVTGESARKSRQLIRRAIAASPGSPVIVTGCYSETEAEIVKGIDGVTYIKGNSKKSDIPDIAEQLIKQNKSETVIDIDDIFTSSFDDMTLSRSPRTRSYIKIEDGCDNRCSYCIIPRARGKVRSKKREDVINEVKGLLGRGCREIILTGIEVAAYGRDADREREEYMGEALAELIEEIAAHGCERISMGSLEPTVMSERFVCRIASVPFVLPHFHLSVQSGSSSVLARMRRRYNADMLEKNIARLKSAIPDVFLTADIIVGFPGETEKEFMETLEFIKRTKFFHLHIFPYSERKGTEAAVMKEKIPVNIRNERLRILSSEQDKIKANLLEEYVSAHLNAPVYALVEKVKDGTASGHSERFVDVEFSTDSDVSGKIAEVLLTGTDGKKCFGKVQQLK